MVLYMSVSAPEALKTKGFIKVSGLGVPFKEGAGFKNPQSVVIPKEYQ